MSQAPKIQMRGNCQCCGRDQAVLASGRMSKHGYEVRDGWFSGVCTGQRYRPMQIEREQADEIIEAVRAECKALMQHAADLLSGKVQPLSAPSAVWHNAPRVKFADAPKFMQEKEVKLAACRADNRARAGESFAGGLERIANECHGQPLRAVPVEAGPAPIMMGERRTAKRGVLTVCRVDGARIYWKDEAGKSSWTGSSAWRRLPIAA